MRKFLLLFLLQGNVASGQVNLEKGLVAYYPFDGNFNDQSGNNHHPVFRNAKLTKDRTGKSNAACSFNGKDQYIQIADHKDFHFRNGFSITTWVMVKGFYEGKCHGNRIVMKGYTD